MPQTTGNLQPITQKDFSGGINAVTSPYLISDKQIARCRNLILDEHGSLSTRDGFSIATADPSVSGSVVWRDSLNKVDGSNFPFVLVQQLDGSGGVASTLLYNTSTLPWTLIGDLNNGTGTLSFTPQAVTMTNEEIFAPGYSIPSIWDGTSFTTMTAAAGQTVPPGAQHIAFHLGSLWVWNTNPSTTTLDGPSSLRMSDADNPNSWPSINQTFISKDDGQVGMGLATFTIAETGISPTQTLVAFKNYSTYQITGVLTLDVSAIPLFSVQKVKSDMGCIAPRSIQFVSGYGLIRLTHKGFALFDGVNDKIISEEIRPYIFGHDDITALNFVAINRSFAAQATNPPLYVAAGPVGGTGLNRVFIYDLVRRAWTICDYPMSLQSLNLFTAPNIQPTLQAGSSTGTPTVFTIFNGDQTDNGTPIDWSFRTRTYFVGSFLRNAYWRRAVFDFAFSPTQPVTVSTTINGLATVQSTLLTYRGQAPGSIWGQAVWGHFRWSGSTLVDGRQSVDILRTAPSVFFDVTGSGFIRMRGIELQGRSKPLNRQVL